MRNNILTGLLASTVLLSTTTIIEAQNPKDDVAAIFMIAHSDLLDIAPFTHSIKNSEKQPADVFPIDYPTVSYPEVNNFKVEKEKAFQHLSWQITGREELVYTEVQSSMDGIHFTPVGEVMNDQMNRKSGTYDYFVPVENNKNISYRLIQYDLNNHNYMSEIFR